MLLPEQSRVSGGTTPYSQVVSTAENTEEPNHLMVVTLQDALERARPLPNEEDMAIDGLTAEEWEAFKQALTGP